MADGEHQFEFNSDYPPEGTPVRTRREFNPPRIEPCDTFTTFVLYDGQPMRATNVVLPRARPVRSQADARGSRSQQRGGNDDDDSDSDWGDDDTDSDDDDDEGGNGSGALLSESRYAFWPLRCIKGAIYGNVYSGIILVRSERNVTTPDGDPVRWEATNKKCAIKKYVRRQIAENHGSAENPYSEIAAMQFLDGYRQNLLREEQMVEGRVLEGEEYLDRIEAGMYQSNVMLPLGVYYDNTNIYNIMPYVDGGELFDVLDNRQRFTEPEARYYMLQIMNGVETLQRAGICHRDMSLENLMTDKEGRALIIDMGMSIKIPYVDDDDRQNTNNNFEDHRQRQRCFIRADRACGKPYYMSPEIRRNRLPFDGHAVDVWALGPILFLMVAGFPPFEIADNADERFYYLSNGYFAQTVRSWNIGLSADLIDLLQRMFFIDPRDRLSLAQVRAHPWFQGEVAPPPPPEGN
mmetsp:Transcript_26463/g.39658  ORF Transcript_26463/g.39658 Transcript_26463/m.39658 type:complete len:463 (-) Transcript_26463:174-1562(-)